MKMCDRFYLPIEAASPYNTSELRDGVGDYLFDVDADDIDVAAICIAINNHDALVEALQKARTGYLNLIELELLPHQGYYDECKEHINEMDKVLAKVRGES